MDPHIVPNLTGDDQKVRASHSAGLSDWHFEAQLFGAGMLLLLLPLVTFARPNVNKQVLGTQTQISNIAYDSDYGYMHPEATSENTDIFSIFITAILSLLN